MHSAAGIDSAYAWRRLAVSVAISTLGGIGMWALAVALPTVQADLGVSRADISFAYSLNMLGFFAGGVIVREYFTPREAGMRMGIAVSATIVGMALGGWMGGVLFDLTGSYRAAFINGFAWNVLNGVMIWWLLVRQTRRNVYA